MLSTILLFSCENNSSCIDADDYGNTQKEIINVSASLTEVCYNSIKPDSYKNQYADISPITTTLTQGDGVAPNALIDCLTKENLKGTYLTLDNVTKLVEGITSYKADGKGCIDLDVNNYEERKLCETICELDCVKKNGKVIDATKLSSDKIWTANTPRKQDSSDGIDITPNSNIFVSAAGEVNFRKTYESELASTIQPLDLTSFAGNQVVKLEFFGNYDDLSTQSYYDLADPTIEKIGKMQGLARRSLVFFTPSSANNNTITLNKIITESEPSLAQSVNGVISHASLTDGFINFKMIKTANCNDAQINVSIKKNGSNITYYKVTNLKLSEVYTTKNIPIYSDSIINIDITNNAIPSKPPEACIIKMKTQGYADTEIPYSGIAQFSKLSAVSCKLFGRIINPDADKMTYTDPNPANEVIGINNDANSDKASIVLSGKEFSYPAGATPFKVKNVYIGLIAYSNKDKKDLAVTSSCNLQLKELTNCKIESSSCSITALDYSSFQLQGCKDGKGESGNIDAGKSGNGGGGGGNLGGIKGSYEANEGAGGNGKRGESYINPEFQLGEIGAPTPPSFPANIKKGAPSSSTSKGGDGYVVFYWDKDKNIPANQFVYTSTNGLITPDPTTQIPPDNKKLHYEIYGGGGGAGGNCGSETGGEGGDGDYFSGILDFSNSSFSSGSTITLKIKVGSGGYSGKNCDITSLTNGSLNPDSIGTKLKGGNGGNDSSLNAGGGAGGSASYISLVRSDEVGDTSREDFLVIAGGGGGGGGAKEIKGRNAKNAEIYSRSKELNSNANGYRLAVAIEALPVMEAGFASDYYEYDDFFTKTIVSSIDPSKNIDVTSNYDGGFFVRKGQILRILPKSFVDAGCNGDISMKITRRPAVLCLDGISESIKNPLCTPNFPIGVNSQQGCAPTSICVKCKPRLPETPPNEELCPVNMNPELEYCKDVENCAKITCSGQGDADNPNTGCTRSNPSPTYSSACNSGCSGRCATLRITEMQKSPKIDINSSICYNFEDETDISVHNFLEKYNTTGADKRLLVDSKKIKKIGNYDRTYNFGNFDNYKKSRLHNSFFETADQISFDSGSFNPFLIKNNNFKEMSNIAYKDPATKIYAISSRDNILPRESEIMVRVLNTPIQQKGKGLQVALCKESTETSNDCLHPEGANILAYFIKFPDLETNAFRFNSFGILERGTGALTDNNPSDNITISLCPNMASGDNFICYTITDTNTYTNDANKTDELKKYRLIFRVKDGDNNYLNNSGEYVIKLEKKDSKNIGSGGVINGILQPIIANLDGAPAANGKPEKPGIVRNFYIQLTYNTVYRSILTLTMVLALSFYGMGYLMGVNELKHSEVVKILLKIGFIYLFTSTETGWLWFNKFFVGFFRNATDYISFSVAETFDYENSASLKVMLQNNNFYDRAVLFKSVDSVIDLILAGAVQKKIMALLFSSIFGWLYFVLMYYCLLTYVYAAANSMLLYITCQVIISILFVLGPIFFIFLMFKVTKDMFDNWLKALIGFSLQQIFLVMTLALFNSFVIGFLKLALGYRVCWTKILSLNIYINKFTLLNFWTVAGTNAPDSITEDSPDESFGDTQNMPSIYLFLYLLVVVSLMKKFIELFTDLAVMIAGGLKASTIAADSANIGKSFFNAASSVASKIFKNTAGRVISRIDNNIFDTGAIGSARRKAERQQFIEDVKTRNELKKVGNTAISEHKKNNALELSGMSVGEQKEKLSKVKQNAIKDYATSKGISSKELERITNASGLNYSGNNLFGMVAQAGKQAAFSGGNLFSSMNDEKINTSFSKSEANSALKKMNNDDQSKFIKAVKEGGVHVNKGKLENTRKMPIVAVKAILNPKATIASAAESAWSVAKKPLSTIAKKPGRIIGFIEPSKADKLKSEVTKELENAGKITTNQPLYWARTDEEKLIIKNAVREKSRQQEVNLPKLTDESTIKDLEATQKLSQDTEKFTGAPLGKDNISLRAMAYRAGTRAKNLFSRDSSSKAKKEEALDKSKKAEKEEVLDKSKKAEKMYENNFINLEKERLKNENDPNNKNSIKNLKEALESKKGLDQDYKDSVELKRFNILEKARDSIYEKEGRGRIKKFFLGKQAEISNEIKEEMKQNGMQDYAKITEGNAFFGMNKKIKPTKAQLTKYFNELIEKEFSKNPELLEGIKQNRYEINEIKAKLNDAEKREKKIAEVKGYFDDAKKIKQEYQNRIDEYEGKPMGKRWAMAMGNKAVSAAFPVRFVVRNTHSLFKSVRDVGTGTADLVRNKYNNNKESNFYKEYKGKTIFKTPESSYREREKYKSAVKAVKEANNMQNPEKFVAKHQKILKNIKKEERPSKSSSVGVSIGAEPPQINSAPPPPSTSTFISS